jgi:hypothetical protein
MKNAACLLDDTLRRYYPTWKDRRENLFDVLTMAGGVPMGMFAEQLGQSKGL